jgi:hypothetical protein
MEVGEGGWQVVDCGQQEMLGRPSRRLDRGRTQRSGAVGGIHDSVNTNGFRASQKRAEVLGILERVEYEHEWGLVPALGGGEDRFDVDQRAWLGDERDALVTVETGQGSERAALQFDDRDAQRGRVNHELVERGAALRDDEQAD